MISFEEFKTYFWYFFGILGVVFFWTGVWDGLGGLSYLSNPLVSFIVGIILIAIGGLLFKESSPFGQFDKRNGAIHKIHKHPLKHEFQVKYNDHIQKKELSFSASKIKKIEKGFMVLIEKNKEIFVPNKRITEIAHKGKTHWKA